MNWIQIQTLFDGQGLVFWAALAAVALGLTLLSVSIFFQVRKMVASSRFLQRRMTARPATVPVVEAAPPQITVTEDGYEATGFVPTAVAPALPAATTSTPADPMLTNLLARLKTSADRLERIHGSLGHNEAQSASTGDSPLKGLGQDVDYVYKTGRA